MGAWTTKKGSTARATYTPCLTCSSIITSRVSVPRKYCSIACRNQNVEYVGMLYSAAAKSGEIDRTGQKNPNWRGGRTAQRSLLMASKAYKDWRKAVYTRDEYKCVECNTPGTGRNLNADHIKPYATHPGLALNVENGRTLCVDCHIKTDTYGWKMFNQLRKMEKLCQV